jgi:cell division protein FtsB
LKLITLILLVLLVMLQYRLWLGHGNLIEVRQLEQTLAEKTAENRGLKERNQSLAAEVVDLKHGLEAIEDRARSEMGMIKQGETFFQIVPAAETPPVPAEKK